MATLLNRFPRSMGCPNQNFIAFNTDQQKDYVKRHIKKSDIYTSVYAFRELTDNSIINRKSAIIDKVFFDFDSDSWLSDMIKIHEWCLQYDILHRCHFSGNGSHVFIFTSESVSNKSEAIGNFQRWIQNELDLQIDKKIIGDISRIFRYPNTWNFKGRRYCIPIPPDKINNSLTKNWLLKHSTHQLFINAWSGSKLLDLSRFDHNELLYVDFEADQINLNDIDSNISIEYPDFPKCIQSWLSTPNLNGEQKFNLILYLKDQLITVAPFDNAEIVSILKKTLSEVEFKHYFGTLSLRGHQGHNGLKFKAIMKKDYYMPNCEELQKKGLCPVDCGRRNPIYD